MILKVLIMRNSISWNCFRSKAVRYRFALTQATAIHRTDEWNGEEQAFLCSLSLRKLNHNRFSVYHGNMFKFPGISDLIASR